MKRVLKWSSMILGGLVGLILLTALGLYAKTRIQFNKTYDVRVEKVILPMDSDSIEHGKHLGTVLCAECHGDDLGGTARCRSHAAACGAGSSAGGGPGFLAPRRAVRRP